MKTICLYFEIHQPNHLKRYRFFDIGSDHYYYDDYENERATADVAQRSYIPALTTMQDMINTYGKDFKVAFSVSGVALESLEQYAPEVVELLQDLSKTGCVEFLAEPYSHGLSSLINNGNFIAETKRQSRKMKELFGHTPKVFRNSSLIYNDEIGATVAQMGFKGVMVEGAKHILGWKSPHYIYSCANDNRLSLLLRDYKLSDDIGLRFNNSAWSEYPLMADKYMGWIASLPEGENVINIMMELSALGIYQPLESNILEFLRSLPLMAKRMNVQFQTPSEVIAKNKPVGPIDVIYPVTWNDEERDTSSLLGNGLQKETFNKLYDENIVGRILACRDRRIKQDWDRLQASDNLRFMSTKNTGIPTYRGIYDSPYDAFTNFMNILGDFQKRVKSLYPDDVENDELNSLYTQIANLENAVNVKDKEISRLHARLKQFEGSEEPAVVEEKPKEAVPAKKPATPKKAAKAAVSKPVVKKTPSKKESKKK
ncbi:MAG: glycoside hydrolase family 57 protein [Bacteroidaceae bacterium]|nr:glycoside hydrolase family 57 protein [Bacteroidaceae bacterium]